MEQRSGIAEPEYVPVELYRADLRDLREDLSRQHEWLTALEIGQRWLIWGVGILMALGVGNVAVTIAMALHSLTQKG